MLALITRGFTSHLGHEKKEVGGTAFGFSRVARDAKALRQAKAAYKQSPHGRLTLIVHKKNARWLLFDLNTWWVDFTRNSVPTYTGYLATLCRDVYPRWFDASKPKIRIRIGGLSYSAHCFLTHIPSFCQRFISLAAFTRRWLISMTRLSWMAQYWYFGYLDVVASLVALSWMGDDIIGSIQIEQNVFEAWLGIQSIPESSFLDLLTALAVMPLAAFTTLSVLGGGSEIPLIG